ncbi:MAG: hypothetical protein WA864_08945 [Acetobacteraceae bacterium]|jgi:hypothetical protein
MTPQSNFMVAAPIARGLEAELRAVLGTMNSSPGVVDPNNPLLPFARFDRLHVARFVILQDETLGDLRQYGETLANLPVWLVFLGDCDGSAKTMLAEFVAQAATGLAKIFEHCVGFDRDGDLLAWMRTNSATPAAQYVNWVGRTVQQIREEDALHTALRERLEGGSTESAIEIHRRMAASVRQLGPALTPAAPTPLPWLANKIGNLIGVPIALIALLPFFILYAPYFLCELRRRENSDAVIAPQPTPEHVSALSELEDRDVTNQFSAFGTVKPGWFRLSTLVLIFWVLNFSTRQIYTRGRLARVGTIHFARWVFMDNRRRLLFASNYDGSLDSYMDDFINKVAYGLNLVFSNGIGYPRTKFLLSGGAKEEMAFKYYLRRHQVPTQAWYKAYPGLTTADLARNTQIREGLESQTMTEAEARRWLALI